MLRRKFVHEFKLEAGDVAQGSWHCSVAACSFRLHRFITGHHFASCPQIDDALNVVSAAAYFSDVAHKFGSGLAWHLITLLIVSERKADDETDHEDCQRLRESK